MAETDQHKLECDEAEAAGLQVPCQPCSRRNKRSDAVIYCAECDEVQCSVCAQDHETYVVMGHHVTVDINEWRFSNDFFHLAKISRCETHGLSYDYYCEHENKLCCKHCIDQSHSSCRIVQKLNELDNIKQTTEHESVDAKFQKLVDETERITLQSEEHIERIKKQVSTLPESIDTMRKKVLEIFDKFDHKIREEAKLYEAVKIDTLGQIKRDTSEVAIDIKNTLANVKSLPHSMTPSQHFVFTKKMEEVFKKYNSKIEAQTNDLQHLNKNISIQLSDKFKEFVQALSDEVESINTHQTEKEETGSDYLSQPNAVEFRLIAASTPHSQQKCLNSLYTGMDFLQNDRLVLADSPKRKCLIVNKSLQVVGEKRLGYAPKNLLVFGKDELLISSGEKQFIDYFEVNSEHILVQIKRINTFMPCDSMSVITDKTFVIGVAGRDSPVCKLSDFEHFSEFNIEFERDRFKLDETKCAYSLRLEMLVLTDIITDTISLINTTTGEKIHVKDRVIKAPRCAVFGKDESIFVCCEGTCCLVQLSPSGEILSYRKLQMSFPYSICISKDKTKIAVSNKCVDECKIQVFSLI